METREERREFEQRSEGVTRELLGMLGSGSSCPEIPLENARTAPVRLAHEKPEHRIVFNLKLRGFTNREIATITGYTPEHVGTITRQEWFLRNMVTTLHADGKQVFKEFMARQVEESLLTICELRDRSASDSVRLASAQDILNRVFGKPAQRSDDSANALSLEDEKASVEQELAEVEREKARLSSERAGQGGQG